MFYRLLKRESTPSMIRRDNKIEMQSLLVTDLGVGTGRVDRRKKRQREKESQMERERETIE
jgi:hypothetical protein